MEQSEKSSGKGTGAEAFDWSRLEEPQPQPPSWRPSRRDQEPSLASFFQVVGGLVCLALLFWFVQTASSVKSKARALQQERYMNGWQNKGAEPYEGATWRGGRR